MAWVCLACATGIVVGMIKTDDRTIRWILAGALALNLLAAGMMLYEDFPYTWRLAPYDD